MSGEKKNLPSNPPAYNESSHSHQNRFSNPIVKVSLSEGVLINRLQSFWSNQNIKTLDRTAS